MRAPRPFCSLPVSTRHLSQTNLAVDIYVFKIDQKDLCRKKTIVKSNSTVVDYVSILSYFITLRNILRNWYVLILPQGR